MQWADSPTATQLAENIERFRDARDIANWNQMANAMQEWAKRRNFTDPVALNTLRNIAAGRNAPRLASLVQIAEFLQVPLYMLFIPDVDGDPSFVVALNAVIATFVNADPATRESIRMLLHGIAGLPGSQPRTAVR